MKQLRILNPSWTRLRLSQELTYFSAALCGWSNHRLDSLRLQHKAEQEEWAALKLYHCTSCHNPLTAEYLKDYPKAIKCAQCSLDSLKKAIGKIDGYESFNERKDGEEGIGF